MVVVACVEVVVVVVVACVVVVVNVFVLVVVVINLVSTFVVVVAIVCVVVFGVGVCGLCCQAGFQEKFAVCGVYKTNVFVCGGQGFAPFVCCSS